MTSKYTQIGALLAALLLPTLAPALAADEATPSQSAQTSWVSQYKRAWNEKLDSALDWAGPDGIVYPNWTYAGVRGGIPDVKGPVFAVQAEAGSDIGVALDEALQKASAAGGGVVQIPAGEFSVKRMFLIQSGNIVVRGAGKDRTKLNFSYALDEHEMRWAYPKTETLTRGDHVEIHAWAGLLPDGYKKTPDTRLKSLELFLNDASRPTDPKTNPLRRVAKTDDGGGVNFSLRYYPFAADWDGAFKYPTMRLVATAEWKDGKKNGIERIVVTDGKTRPAPKKWRTPESPVTSLFYFQGDSWTQRRQKLTLTKPAKRGDTVIYLDKNAAELGEDSWAVGDYLTLTASASKQFLRKLATPYPVQRNQAFYIRAIDGDAVTLNQPLRLDFPTEEGDEKELTKASISYPLERCGLEDLTIEQTTPIWTSGVQFNRAVDSWVRGVDFIKPGRFPFLPGEKNFEVRDVNVAGAWFTNTGGGTGYILAGGHDNLFENMSSTALRHSPDFSGGTGCVVRNGRFIQSDAQWHNLWGVEHLLENCFVDAERGTGSYGWGVFAQRNESDIHGPGGGPRNVVYGNDVKAPLGGLFLGGSNENWIIAHNRFLAEREPGLVFRNRSFDHIVWNNVMRVENRFQSGIQFGGYTTERERKAFPDAPDDGLNNGGSEFYGNTIYGGNGQIFQGPSAPLASGGNRVFAFAGEVPRPQPEMKSVFETQRQHPQGMAPATAPWAAVRALPDKTRPDLGELVAQINFQPNPEDPRIPAPRAGWLGDWGEAFGPRAGGFSYGWTGSKGNLRALRMSRDEDHRYDTNVFLGDGENGVSWSIELPAGDYAVYAVAGDSRRPNKIDPNGAIERITDLKINGQLFSDADGSDNYDTYQATVSVGAAPDNRLTIANGPLAKENQLVFVQIYRVGK